MVPEIGNFALVLAFCLAVVQAVMPIAGAQFGRTDWMRMARPAAAGQFVFVAIAFIVLAQAFLNSDFSVYYVAANSNTNLPNFYKVAAVWGGHEGSLLFWIMTLAMWTLFVVVRSRSQPEEFTSRVIGVLGIVSAGIILFTLTTSNPFDRLANVPLEGNDLNPLLQDPAMVVHPPMLYIGYVGMAVPFAFAVAALLTGRLDKDWARWTRPWTTVAWMFLTIGIALGSWWAYYELGWGGWWFWDPVENSSFMPWLMATALLHSLAVTEKRGIFKSWTVLLAIAAFTLSFLGTFLTRSGVLISVHAFAADPERGLFLLALIAVFAGGALILYALRAQHFIAEGGFKLLSREAFLLANNILLVVATGLVLFGTLYPLIIDALGYAKLSVGPPYFNVVFLTPMLPLALLLGVGMHVAWKRMRGHTLIESLRWPAIFAVVFGMTVPWVFFGSASILTTVALVTGLWVVLAALVDPFRRVLATRSWPRFPLAQWGMIVAHLGLGLFICGATLTSSYNVETDRAVAPGDRWQVAGYDIAFNNLREVDGPNFKAIEGEFELSRNGETIAMMRPQKRVYEVQQSPMTEAAIDGALHRDVFIALGDSLGGDRGAWSVRVQVKPMIRFIWIGAVVMAFGGLLAVADRRYRQPARESSPTTAIGEPQPAGGR